MRWPTTLLTILPLAAAPLAHAAVLDFDYTAVPLTTADSAGTGALLPLGSAGWISQGYGDVPGLVDVSFRYLDTAGQVASSLQSWVSGYDELVYTAWHGVQSGGDRAQVELASVAGSTVTLASFDLGSWADGNGRAETVSVYEIGNPVPVFSFSGLIGVGNLSNRFTVGLQSNTGFIIEWSSPWWTAIDNIDSSAVPVPEPGGWALMAAGLAGLAALRRSAGRR